MNCAQANSSIALTDLMERLGYNVQKKERGGSEWRYLSPFRKEAEPSFYINVNDNCWYDHGEAEGSNSVIDFAIKYLGSTGKSSGVSEALFWLKSLGYGSGQTKPLFSSESDQNIEDSQKEVPRDLEFIRAKPINHPAIFQYLEGRGISKALTSKYLVELQYRNIPKDKVYFGFGIQNRAGGYEVRSASDTPVFKSALIKRDFTIIPGRKEGKILSIFEGITDFLSLLTFLKTESLSGDAIIMHSLSSAKDVTSYCKQKSYSKINLWLDNDKSGKKMAVKLISELPGQVLDQSVRYEGFSDLNDALKARITGKEDFTLDFS